MAIIREFLIIALLCSIGVAYSLLSGKAPKYTELEAGAILFQDASALEPIWIDARSRQDFEQSHLPAAIWYDSNPESESLLTIFEQWFENPRVIVVYCSDPRCKLSQQVAEELRNNIEGAEIYHLAGGWQP